MSSTRDIALTLAGGGNRALAQIGLLRKWLPRLLPRLAAVSTCSAGAGMAVSLFTGRELLATANWFGRRAGVRKNVEWSRLLRGRRPTPHTPIYRDLLRYALSDGGLARIQSLPFPVYTLSAAPPWWLPMPLATVLGMTAYTLERQMRPGKLHPSSGRGMGFSPVVNDLRSCRSIEEVVDLVMASSATPPFTPVGRQRGVWLLDGGLVDNAPAFVAETIPGIRKHLVLLTRPYPAGSVGRRGIRWYLCPSEAPAISRWEYRRPDLAAETIARGARDAARWDPEFTAWLESAPP